MGITARITIDPMAGRRLTPRARDLRRNQTDAEERLWSELHGRRLAEAKLTRQYQIGDFIADFACRSGVHPSVRVRSGTGRNGGTRA